MPEITLVNAETTNVNEMAQPGADSIGDEEIFIEELPAFGLALLQGYESIYK